MNTNISNLEREAAALGLNLGSKASSLPEITRVGALEKRLLGFGCCVLAAGSAVFNVWLIGPTLAVSAMAAIRLVRHLDARQPASASDPAMGAAHCDDDGGRHDVDGQSKLRAVALSRDIISNPAFRWMACNIFYRE